MKKVLILIALAATLAVAGTASALPYNVLEATYNNFFWLGDFHTYDYASAVDFYRCVPDGWLGGVYIGTATDLPHSFSWGHTLPSGLMVPPDDVTRAKLWIDAYDVETDDNTVAIEGTFDWDPLNHTWLDNTTYNLTNVNVAGFWNNSPLDVTVTAGERTLRLDKAVLMLDYETGVPEPATLVLLGSGLVGLGVIRRRMKK